MHGRPRKAPTPEEEKALAVKATKLRALQSQFLQFHHDQIYTAEALGVSAKLLEANPEFYSAWNYRKLGVQHNLTLLQANPDSDSDSIQSIFDQELRLVENALKRNFKSYGAWHHRKWILSKGHSSTDRELRLLDLFQKQDSRNFHAWNYRRFIAGLRNISHEEELKVTTDMISDNFSNYSAWHNRSVLLSELLKERAQGYYPKENVLTEEYEFVRNALFTDPDDQSSWFYHLWLLEQTVKNNFNLSVSSWPPHGSNLDLSTNDSYPLVLHFNEPVEGVNSSTVTIEGEKDESSNHTWCPLSTNNNSFAQTWVTRIKTCKVKIVIGESQGITSLSGARINHPINVKFTVNIQLGDSEHDVESIISWRDENFQIWTESNLPNSLYALRINEDDKPEASQWNLETTTNEISHFHDLLSWTNCKIGKLTLARLLMAHDSMMSANNQNIHEEVLDLYCDLVKLDPPHSQFYKDEYSLTLLKQVTSQESLLDYCHQYKDPYSLSTERYICLRLNNLSLSRIGSFEKLLWVRMLDLSHNQLQSIEGLESMQLLTCLNLSNNKISSFTALDPLRLVKSLEVLDISHNEIGSHTIDSRRYLCASPLSHTVSKYLNLDEIDTCDLTITNYWEAFSVLSGSNLIQLDIVGNSVAEDERFIHFLGRLLPGLKWLDGQNVAH
jgi:geranylgeranyl transferase type-2 subunit alpha